MNQVSIATGFSSELGERLGLAIQRSRDTYLIHNQGYLFLIHLKFGLLGSLGCFSFFRFIRIIGLYWIFRYIRIFGLFGLLCFIGFFRSFPFFGVLHYCFFPFIIGFFGSFKCLYEGYSPRKVKIISLTFHFSLVVVARIKKWIFLIRIGKIWPSLDSLIC